MIAGRSEGAGSRECPHCRVNYFAQGFPQTQVARMNEGADGHWWVRSEQCPSCLKVIIWLMAADGSGTFRPNGGQEWPTNVVSQFLVHPKGTGRPPVPPEVPVELAEDYTEACLVLADSPKASAALSRRCLQSILRDRAGVQNPDNLMSAIEEVISAPGIPSDIKESLDAVRNIGNFAAHPNKSVNTGEIMPVEPQEAEWCLDVIEMLFGFYFVGPADIQRRRDALNEKLAEMGKPNMLAPEANI